MWLNRWALPAKRGLRSKIFVCAPACVCLCVCFGGNATLSWAQAMAGKQICWKELEEVHNALPTDTHTETWCERIMHTQYISLHIHRLNTSHSQYSVCPWQLESFCLSVRNTCKHTQQTHIDTIHVKTAALTIQSRALQCPSFKSVTQQERFHWKVLRNYRGKK